MYCVMVTYGTVRNQVYAGGIRTLADARKLREAALERCYPDARIVEAHPAETSFREAQAPYGRRSAYPRPAA